MDNRSARTIIDDIKRIISKGDTVSKSYWLDCAFMLSIFLEDEQKKLNQLNLNLAVEKKRVFEKQDKKNVSAVQVELEATEAYREAQDQEATVYTIKELVRVAKKNSENDY